MKNNYTVGLKVLLVIVTLALLHTASNILGSFGVISDLFTVLGAYQVWLNVRTKEARQNTLTKVTGFVNVDDIGEIVSEKVEEIKSQFNSSSEVNIKNIVDDLVVQEEKELVEPLNYSTEVEPVSTDTSFKDGSGI